MNTDRRTFLYQTSDWAASTLLLAKGLAQEKPGSFPGLTVRMNEPRNLEFPMEALRTSIIPNEQFFVRSHYAVPQIDVKNWKLVVEGAVENKLELTYAQVKEMAKKSLTNTIECAGNGRVFLTPPVPGLQWGNGGVGNAEWTGVPLAAILDKAKVKDNAVEVILEGSDTGPINNDPKSPGPISFSRSLPMKKAKQDDVLLAYQMNGEELPASHGFPLRAVVGGWYGMSSIKWLTRIVVSPKPFQGFWQTLDYSTWEKIDGIHSLVVLAEMQPKAIIARPGIDGTVAAGKETTIFGVAWAGEQAVTAVEVSTAPGQWSQAKLLGKPKPYEWIFWELPWTPAKPGKYALVARCEDSAKRTQPEQRDINRRTYKINHLVPVPVTAK